MNRLKGQVVLCFQRLGILCHLTHGRQCVPHSQCSVWKLVTWKPQWAKKLFPKSVELPASQFHLMDCPFLLWMQAIPLVWYTHTHLRKEMTELREWHEYWGSCVLICLKICVLLKQMWKLAIWEPSLGTYLHLSPHLGEGGTLQNHCTVCL